MIFKFTYLYIPRLWALVCYGKFPKIGSRKLRSVIHGISCIIKMKLRTRQEHIMEAYRK